MTILIDLRLDVTPRGWDRATPWMGRSLTTRAQRQYQNILASSARRAMKSQEPYPGAVSIVVGAFFPIPKSWTRAEREAALTGSRPHTSVPDCDNCLKAVMDSFKGIVWNDDRQVCQATVTKKYSSSPALIIKVNKA